MKKLLTLLGSVAIVGSSAAVAVACENRPFSALVKKSTESKPQTLDSSPEGIDGMVGDQPRDEDAIRKELEEKLREAKETVNKTMADFRSSQEKYSKLTAKYHRNGTGIDSTKADEIDKAESELGEAMRKYHAAKQKLEELKDYASNNGIIVEPKKEDQAGKEKEKVEPKKEDQAGKEKKK
ncbi:Vmc-like lipoprotein signal peptide domain-containing protein [Mycoplasma feriruminatoris]|uniref:Vmc-like lipoprotein signal peptide domain-containing protein n=1 Tax=Mycoplasma feriruminatoris TaxID=1179777 RepID=UPI00241F3C1B|nr:lipoprotein [Mycoplasma feriruminatoris]WFQ94449.1 hypothetical protein MFERI15220_00528 [Mycoplasma feriruminatoris]